MRTGPIAATLLCISALAQAQAPAPAPIKDFVAASEVSAKVTASAMLKPGEAEPGPLLAVAPYQMKVEYRTAPAVFAGAHEKAAELFVVLDGKGAMTLGGTLIDDKYDPKTGNHRAKGIANGRVQPLAKGDMLIVPVNTPHQVTSVDGTLALGAMHLPIAAH